VLLATARDAGDVVVLPPQDAERLPLALGDVVRRVAEAHPVDGLYTTGGDVTAAVLAALGADGLEVDDEVVPLAVAGSLVGGPWDGVPVVTKGGLVGDSGTAVACVDHLTATIAVRARRVPAAGRRRSTPAADAPPRPPQESP
jgi:D-threonate/D-erythronate kinase